MRIDEFGVSRPGQAGDWREGKSIISFTNERTARNMDKVNVAEKFDLFSDYWSPKIAAELNDSYIKLAKMKGEFVWHHHEHEDELFFVMKGCLVISCATVRSVSVPENSSLSLAALITCQWLKTRFTSS